MRPDGSRATAIPTVALAPGASASRIVRGGWQVHVAASFDAAAEAERIDAFMAAGVTTFETADTYRHVDEALRRAVAGRAAAGLAPPRIHARLSLPGNPDDGLAGLRRRLGCVPDLVQLQMWALDEERLGEAALRIADRCAAGDCGALGLMNMGEGTIGRLLRRGVRPLTVQVQLSLLDRRPLRALAPLARHEGLHLLAYGTLAGGFLDEAWLGVADPGPRAAPDGRHFHAEYRAIVEAFGGWALFQDLLRTLDAVARRHGVPIPAIATRWVLDRPGVAAVLVGAREPSRAAAWATIFGVRLEAADTAAIDAVLARSAGPTGEPGELERDPASPLARAIAAAAASVRDGA